MSVGPNRYAAPIKEEYTFFSRAHRTLCKIEHGLGYKTSPNKSKIKIIYSIFFDIYIWISTLPYQCFKQLKNADCPGKESEYLVPAAAH